MSMTLIREHLITSISYCDSNVIFCRGSKVNVCVLQAVVSIFSSDYAPEV